MDLYSLLGARWRTSDVSMERSEPPHQPQVTALVLMFWSQSDRTPCRVSGCVGLHGGLPEDISMSWSLEPVNDLLWKRVFADTIKHLEMRSSWVTQVG